jgi:hypothetical protein
MILARRREGEMVFHSLDTRFAAVRTCEAAVLGVIDNRTYARCYAGDLII